VYHALPLVRGGLLHLIPGAVPAVEAHGLRAPVPQHHHERADDAHPRHRGRGRQKGQAPGAPSAEACLYVQLYVCIRNRTRLPTCSAAGPRRTQLLGTHVCGVNRCVVVARRSLPAAGHRRRLWQHEPTPTAAEPPRLLDVCASRALPRAQIRACPLDADARKVPAPACSPPAGGCLLGVGAARRKGRVLGCVCGVCCVRGSSVLVCVLCAC
jgi:hypothetical protein